MNLYAAKTQLSSLVEEAASGAEIVIAKRVAVVTHDPHFKSYDVPIIWT